MRSIALTMGALAALFALASCSKSQPDASAPTTAQTSDATPRADAKSATPAPASSNADAKDPCRLLEPKEVEVLIGPLAGPPFRTHDTADDAAPDAGGNACRYESADLRSVTAAITWDGGGAAMRMVGVPGALVSGKVKGEIPKGLLPEGVTLAGEWDEASVIGCCRILALRGDSLVALDFASTRAKSEQALRLLNSALLRLDKPLALDGRAGNQAAEQRHAARPVQRSACTLVTRAEAEAIFGALRSEPKGDDKSCVYAVAAPAKFETSAKETTDILNMLASGTQSADVRLTVKWRNGFSELRGGVAMMGGMQQMMEKFAKMAPAGEVTGGPWDEAWQTSGGFMAVKKDVLVGVETATLLGGADLDKRRRLVAKAIEKL